MCRKKILAKRVENKVPRKKKKSMRASRAFREVQFLPRPQGVSILGTQGPERSLRTKTQTIAESFIRSVIL